MNSTETDGASVPPQPPPPTEAGSTATDAGPRVSGAQMRDVALLRRSRQDRTVAGVAAGLARHFDVDPTVVRVAFVVLALFGGAGVFLYAALWLLVPDEGRDRSVLGTSGELQRLLVIGALAVAALIVLGQGWSGLGGWWLGPVLPVAALVIVGVAVLANRDQRHGGPDTPASVPSGSAAYAVGVDEAAPPTSPPAPPVGAGWVPPYRPPTPRPRRTGVVLLWPTLALIAVALGALGIYDGTHAVAQAAYPALALAIIGLALVIGAFKGRPGGLTFAGIVTAIVLAITSASGGFHEGAHLTYQPPTAGDVRSTYHLSTGDIVLDLSTIDHPGRLDGRTIDIAAGTGSVEVIVPRGVRVDVNAHIVVAGGYQIGGDEGGGFGTDRFATLDAPAGAPIVDLNVKLRVGQITVRHP